jgi:hypothetical protein
MGETSRLLEPAITTIVGPMAANITAWRMEIGVASTLAAEFENSGGGRVAWTKRLQRGCTDQKVRIRKSESGCTGEDAPIKRFGFGSTN